MQASIENGQSDVQEDIVPLSHFEIQDNHQYQ
jgi:hypothetical protein